METNMSTDVSPDVLSSVRARPLFQLREQVPPLYVVGQTPNAFRRIGVITGGSFKGERLTGEVVSGGNDWQDVRRDTCTKLDVRLLLKTTDRALIVMTYQVLRHGPPAVMQALDRGETIDPASYYFRLTALFETGAVKYDWLNRVIAIGIGDRHPDGPLYNVFEVL
jgi:Protein of unknown function (DUF3237)